MVILRRGLPAGPYREIFHRIVLERDAPDGGLHANTASFLVDIGHFAQETRVILRKYEFQFQRATLVCRQVPEEVVPADPYSSVPVLVELGDAEDARRMDNMPVRLVIIEETFEVCHVDAALFIAYHVEVAVMRLVGRRQIVGKKRESVFRHSLARAQQTYDQDV